MKKMVILYLVKNKAKSKYFLRPVDKSETVGSRRREMLNICVQGCLKTSITGTKFTESLIFCSSFFVFFIVNSFKYMMNNVRKKKEFTITVKCVVMIILSYYTMPGTNKVRKVSTEITKVLRKLTILRLSTLVSM